MTPIYYRCGRCLSVCTNPDTCRYCGCTVLTREPERESAGGTVSQPIQPVNRIVEEQMHRCDNCARVWNDKQLGDIADYSMRVTPGCPAPSGECAECGALCYPIKATKPNPFTNVPIAPEATTCGCGSVDCDGTHKPMECGADAVIAVNLGGYKQQYCSPCFIRAFHLDTVTSLEPVRESTQATVPSDDPTAEKQFRIYYKHLDCPVDPEIEWEDTWSCAVNGECPACHTKDIEPVDWEDVLNTDEDQTPSASEEQERWR